MSSSSVLGWDIRIIMSDACRAAPKSLRRYDGGPNGCHPAQENEPVAISCINGPIGAVAVAQARSSLLILGKCVDQAARRIDHRADTIVRRADDPAPIFGGAHAHDLQVL